MLVCVMVAATSCKNKEENPEQSTTEVTTEAATRFDYFAIENCADYISIDPSVYANMSIELEDKYSVSDEKVEEYIEYLRFSKKTIKNAGAKLTEEPIRFGDTAYVFYKGVLLDDEGNVVLDENGKEKEFEGGSNMSSESPYALSIGSGSFIDDFEDQLIGVVPSETSPTKLVSVDVTFPADYTEATLAGKNARFYVYVSWLVQYEVPEYNETFIKETLGYVPTTEDVIAEHKAYLRSVMEKEFETSKQEDIESLIWDKLYASATVVKLPESEVEYFYKSYCADLEEAMQYYNYAYSYGFTDVQVFARWYLGLDEKGDWSAVILGEAKKAVTQTILYHAIAQQCGIQITTEKFEASVAEYMSLYAQSGYSYTRDQIIEKLGETSIKEGVLYELVVEYIKDRATITYKAV